MPNLNEVLEPIRAQHKLPALGAVVIRNRKPGAVSMVGKRSVDSKESVKPRDPFHIGSCTKSMTATVIAYLVDQGKLRWENTIGELLPDIRLKIHSGYKNVTIVHLLTHRSGLPEDRTPNLGLFLQLRALKSDQRLKASELILQQEPVAEPGKQMLYSNGGYVVVGAIAEAVTGKSWETLMREVLFHPLGIKSAGFGAPQNGPLGHQKALFGYKPVPPSSPFADNPPVLAPAGTVHLCLQDWARYAILHLKGYAQDKPPTLREETLLRLHTPPQGGNYAMGWAIGQTPKAQKTVLQHAGSNGMWYALIALVPGRGDGILLATNAGDDNAVNGIKQALDTLYQQLGV